MEPYSSHQWSFFKADTTKGFLSRTDSYSSHMSYYNNDKTCMLALKTKHNQLMPSYDKTYWQAWLTCTNKTATQSNSTPNT